LQPLSLNADSVTTAITTATASTVAIPNAASGRPRVVMIVTDQIVAFRPCLVGYVGTQAADSRLRPDTPLLVNVSGFTHMAFRNDSGSTANVTITPLDNVL
jgi:hypothetical protein